MIDSEGFDICEKCGVVRPCHAHDHTRPSIFFKYNEHHAFVPIPIKLLKALADAGIVIGRTDDGDYKIYKNPKPLKKKK